MQALTTAAGRQSQAVTKACSYCDVLYLLIKAAVFVMASVMYTRNLAGLCSNQVGGCWVVSVFCAISALL